EILPCYAAFAKNFIYSTLAAFTITLLCNVDFTKSLSKTPPPQRRASPTNATTARNFLKEYCFCANFSK
ncbi:MAG: hypothetical protein D8H92_15190, partial [Campylobacter sp.]